LVPGEDGDGAWPAGYPGAEHIEFPSRVPEPDDDPGCAFVYQAEADLAHNVGRADADGWSANATDDGAGHMACGPYATDWGGGDAQAVFELMVDDASRDDLVVATLDVHDATAGEVLATREVRRRELVEPWRYRSFALDVWLAGREGHAIETASIFTTCATCGSTPSRSSRCREHRGGPAVTSNAQGKHGPSPGLDPAAQADAAQLVSRSPGVRSIFSTLRPSPGSRGQV
jgi:hypothetical protein